MEIHHAVSVAFFRAVAGITKEISLKGFLKKAGLIPSTIIKSVSIQISEKKIPVRIPVDIPGDSTDEFIQRQFWGKIWNKSWTQQKWLEKF